MKPARKTFKHFLTSEVLTDEHGSRIHKFFEVIKIGSVGQIDAYAELFNYQRPSDGFSAVHVGVSHNRLDMLEALLKAEASCFLVSRTGKTALDLAAKIADINPAITNLLKFRFFAKEIEKDDLAGILAYGDMFKHRDTISGLTGLHIAVKLEKIKAIEVLLGHGANPSIVDEEGQTPFNLTETCKSPAIAKQFSDSAHQYLVKKIMDGGFQQMLLYGNWFNYHGADGLVPLHVAINAINVSAVEILLEGGADPEFETAAGVTPLMLAQANYTKDPTGYEKIIGLIQAKISQETELLSGSEFGTPSVSSERSLTPERELSKEEESLQEDDPGFMPSRGPYRNLLALTGGVSDTTLPKLEPVMQEARKVTKIADILGITDEALLGDAPRGSEAEI